MKKIFIADSNHLKEVSRKKANGYTRFVVPDGVNVTDQFEFATDGKDLVLEKQDGPDGEEVLTILCREFGLVDGELGFTSEISVIYLDEGWMLVTLWKGALVVMLDGQMMMPMAGGVEKTPRVVTESIMWVDQRRLIQYIKYYDGSQSKFPYDFEFFYSIRGEAGGDFYIKMHKDEDIDISLGAVAAYEQSLINKAEYDRAHAIFERTIGSSCAGRMQFEYDDEEDEEEEEGEEDEGYCFD